MIFILANDAHLARSWAENEGISDGNSSAVLSRGMTSAAMNALGSSEERTFALSRTIVTVKHGGSCLS